MVIRTVLPALAAVLATAVSIPAQNPLSRKPANPLAAKAKDPFCRAFQGDGIALQLAVAGKGGYAGTLTFAGDKYPATAVQRAPNWIDGWFESGGESYEFRCVVSDDDMTLSSGGKDYALRAAGAKPRGKVDLGEYAKTKKPPGLAGAYTGATTRWKHPRGYFTCELPTGWSIAQVTDEAVLVNPGLTENDTLDAILLVTYGELDEGERGKDVVKLLNEGEPELRRSLSAEGIQVQKAEQPARKVLVGDLPGAEQTWKGSAGNNRVDVWLGGLVKREYYLAVTAIVAVGKEERFLPGAKRIFQSMQPKPPERNRAAERALAGASFFKSSIHEGGSFHVTYKFGTDGSVRKDIMAGGILGNEDVSANTDDAGNYQVVGDVLYMAFPSGQESGKVIMANGDVGSLKFGDAVYGRR